MNYETTIRADAADGVATEYVGARTLAAPAIPRWLIVGGLGLFALLLAVAAWFALAGGEPVAVDDDNSQAPSVTVVTPGRTTVAGEIEAPGTLAARRPMPVGVVGEGGQVLRVTVDAGDWVQQGQVLAVIDRSVQVQQAEAQAAQIEVARADANLAQANLDRALQLVARGFVSKADVDRLTATRDAAVARVKVAQAQLAEQRARNQRLNILAPATGYVLSRAVEPGQTVGAGTPALFTIASGGEMEMLAQLSEEQLAKLSVGTMATITPAGSDQRFSGQVWQIAPVIDQTSRQGTARIALSFAPELRPGGFATARINSGSFSATVLPESAVLADDKGSFVYVVGEDNKAVRRPVKTGAVTANGIAITEGLNGTERVVLRAGGFLNPGESVNPQPLKK
ncbi:efflux RND transporter periplasmic adaptor subunit [Porphyrobacter sp. CACIAM 03H1]|jgi:RND family efflux transporter MFP subunit|uniref:efflux RND transporter periplasmic adaptor subunit n=1 Tax=Porphyrobacter sp. CACIAM 03H1 TaxID=2003315 RepID=UPI000B5A8E45|nr:efflux RND transporter periplasmic adaptor subunit [Porphyrobacter sp. CACIAM 03H1]ASJ89752.1 efflux transporter periplasmic adaptor subunit [Porphyrobacter sp. CACIAM 03H1]